MTEAERAGHDHSVEANRRAGQVVLEYVVVAGITLTLIVMLALLLYVFKEYGGRILDLLASEYP